MNGMNFFNFFIIPRQQQLVADGTSTDGELKSIQSLECCRYNRGVTDYFVFFTIFSCYTVGYRLL